MGFRVPARAGGHWVGCEIHSHPKHSRMILWQRTRGSAVPVRTSLSLFSVCAGAGEHLSCFFLLLTPDGRTLLGWGCSQRWTWGRESPPHLELPAGHPGFGVTLMSPEQLPQPPLQGCTSLLIIPRFPCQTFTSAALGLRETSFSLAGIIFTFHTEPLGPGSALGHVWAVPARPLQGLCSLCAPTGQTPSPSPGSHARHTIRAWEKPRGSSGKHLKYSSDEGECSGAERGSQPNSEKSCLGQSQTSRRVQTEQEQLQTPPSSAGGIGWGTSGKTSSFWENQRSSS